MSSEPVRPAALLLDMDGLLVDTEPLWTVVESATMTELGGVWGEDVKAAVMGRRLEEAVAVMVALAGSDADPAAVSAQVLAGVVALVEADCRWLPGARELVDAARAAGVPTALVSSSYRVLVDAVLARVGAAFDVTVSGSDVTHVKPHPEPYERAAALLGVRAQDCVAFEDSQSGITSALAAGCRVVAIPSLVRLEAQPGVLLLDSLLDVDLAALGL